MDDASRADRSVVVRVGTAARHLIEEFGRGRAPVGAVTAAHELSAAAEEALQAAVDRARATGVSWREIGDALGTSRQAAFQRFGHPIDPRTGEPMSRDVPTDAAERAVAILTWHDEGRYDELIAEFDDNLRKVLDADRMAGGRAHMAGRFGRLERMGEPFAQRAGDDIIVEVPLHYEAGDVRGLVRFDVDGNVAGLAIRPARADQG